jgi:hypothetical protein
MKGSSGGLVRKCLPELLHNPRARRMSRDMDMENPSPAVFDDEEMVQDSDGEGWPVKKSMAAMTSR